MLGGGGVGGERQGGGHSTWKTASWGLVMRPGSAAARRSQEGGGAVALTVCTTHPQHLHGATRHPVSSFCLFACVWLFLRMPLDSVHALALGPAAATAILFF